MAPVQPDSMQPRSRWRRLGFAIWPGICVLCNSAADLPMDLCRACRDDLPWNSMPCERCALPMMRTAALCGACLGRTPPQQRTVAALRYEGDVPGLVTALKFGRSLVHGRVLATLMTHAIATSYGANELPQLIVPVPLSRRRLFMRGHNQAGVLARYVGGELGIPVDFDTVRRSRHTAPQAGQTRSARLRNLRGAFTLRSRPMATCVAVVDDVMTTGSTVHALARTLLRAGVPAVHVWVAARTPAGAVTIHGAA